MVSIRIFNKCPFVKMSESLSKYLSYGVTSGSELKSCIKIDKPLVVNRFLGDVIE